MTTSSNNAEPTSILKEILAANQEYSNSFNPTLSHSPRFAVLTCMDARLDPVKFAGLAEGDAHVIRNAGGRASDDVLRIRTHPLIPSSIPIYDYLYNVHSGKLIEVFSTFPTWQT